MPLSPATSLTRRIFYSNGTINDLLLDWANGIIDIWLSYEEV